MKWNLGVMEEWSVAVSVRQSNTPVLHYSNSYAVTFCGESWLVNFNSSRSYCN